MAYPGRQDSVTSTGERRQDVTEGAIKQLGEAFQRIQELETKLHEQKLEHKQEVEEFREAIIILEDERVKNVQLLQDSEEDFRRQLVGAKRRQEADLFQDEQRRLQDTLASFKHEKEQLQALADQTESKVRQVEQNYADKLKEWAGPQGPSGGRPSTAPNRTRCQG
ncbi:unnamed protein product [Effrenium voratum]|nr:unnamed protein product [Effrenium voratum]